MATKTMDRPNSQVTFKHTLTALKVQLNIMSKRQNVHSIRFRDKGCPRYEIMNMFGESAAGLIRFSLELSSGDLAGKQLPASVSLQRNSAGQRHPSCSSSLSQHWYYSLTFTWNYSFKSSVVEENKCFMICDMDHSSSSGGFRRKLTSWLNHYVHKVTISTWDWSN